MELIKLDPAVKKQTVCDSSEAVFPSSSAGLIVLDENGSILQINESAQSIMGVEGKTVIGKPYNDVICKPLNLEDKFKFDQLSILTSDHLYKTGRFINSDMDGEIQLSVMPLKWANSEKSGYMVCLYDWDLFERKAEAKIRNERLTAMSDIAATIAHEIRNPLGCIELFASSLKYAAAKNDFSEQADTISKCIKTINSILENIKLFFEAELKPTFSEVDIHDHLKESLSFSKYLCGEGADIFIQKKFSEEALIIHGDNELLKQMSMNIILNAFQAIKHSGEIEICTKKTIDHHTGKSYAEIHYVDNGAGIKQSHLKKVFDPYFTTKNMGQGLGLSIVNNIVRLHDGSIHIKKRNPNGTKISILFPLTSDKCIHNVA